MYLVFQNICLFYSHSGNQWWKSEDVMTRYENIVFPLSYEVSKCHLILRVPVGRFG